MKKLILFITLCKVLINLSKSNSVQCDNTFKQMNRIKDELFTLLISNNL